MTEAQLQRSIIVALKKQGAYVIKVIAAGHTGVPDLICCYQGRFIAIEVKMPGKPLDPKQKYEMGAIEMGAGGRVGVARSVADALTILGEQPQPYL